jgi:hypothetical protein
MILSSLALVRLAQDWELFLDLEAPMLLSRLSKLVQSLSRSVRKLLRFVLICNLSFRSSFFSSFRPVFLPSMQDYTHWVRKNGTPATVSDFQVGF